MMHSSKDNCSIAEAEALEGEKKFYEGYLWTLNPFPTVGESVGHLRREIDKLQTTRSHWQHLELQRNIYLLACGVLNCVDEYLRGPALRVPTRFSMTRPIRVAAHLVELLARNPRSWPKLRRWRTEFLERLKRVLRLVISEQGDDELVAAGNALRELLEVPFPRALLNAYVGTPTAYSRIDLTHHDYLALGERFLRRHQDLTRPLLCLGIRTSGAYFAPLLAAYLEARGCIDIHTLTIEPNKGVGFHEMRQLRHFARHGYWVLIVDDPPHTSRTVSAALRAVSYAGFMPAHTKILAATHPANRSWSKRLPEDSVISIIPEEWHKHALLDSARVEERIRDYYHGRGLDEITLVPSPRCEAANAVIQAAVDDPRGRRLKRVYEVQYRPRGGDRQTSYLLAKGVGWGWLGYRAFLIALRLKGRVPGLLGLRDGILYMEWHPERVLSVAEKRSEIIESTAPYIGARVRELGMPGEGSPDLGRYNNGIRLLQKSLSRAFGRVLVSRLMQPWLGRRIREAFGGPSTLIDGNMGCCEWIVTPDACLKSGFEHHGMGKAGLNVTDPAYDLADVILNLQLSQDEERKVVRQYIAETRDVGVGRRLFLNKLLAGLWRMKEAQELLFNSVRGGEAQRECHSRFMRAWNFLTTETARHCGSLCSQPTDLQWRAPIVFLDIDGVVDSRLFGFPCTTAAGISAISRLHSHGLSIALNTARSVAEVKEYCAAYALAGAVAEHGAWLYDAISRQGRIVISDESMFQLERMRERLQNTPGVFMDERHRYSIRAFTYREKPPGLIRTLADSARFSPVGDGALAPMSTQLVHHLLEDMRLDRLGFHHTSIDTAIIAKETDKGRGLLALRDWVLGPDCATIAVGDGDADLDMFAVATHSFGPASLSSWNQARLLGCQRASSSGQKALLEIVDRVLHAGQDDCPVCKGSLCGQDAEHDLFYRLLRVADQKPLRRLLAAVSNRSAYEALIR